ncbi:Os01g0888750 [Oryza sativa Japonica Group]|uniref:Os01g0888750 protein n=1 Tax=Oryza sativa subsp. japonica TaxID=39947 RepID=A0A0P0VBH5_ORYSJ|nr:hypothetical protein EE612_007278 [Oryza sativa]BAS75636.1 Os01g0888750 [Oryza sativa Japonica Group]
MVPFPLYLYAFLEEIGLLRPCAAAIALFLCLFSCFAKASSSSPSGSSDESSSLSSLSCDSVGSLASPLLEGDGFIELFSPLQLVLVSYLGNGTIY